MSVTQTLDQSNSFMQNALLKPLNALNNGHIQLQGIVNGSIGDSHSDLSCVVTVHDSQLFKLAFSQGVLGVAEAYLNGYWDTDDLVCLIRIFSRNRHLLDRVNSNFFSKISQLGFKYWYWKTRNNRRGSARNIAAHYDLSNDFFKLWLDSKMMYSSALFSSPEMTLEEASEAKLRSICDKLELKETDHVIEIGSGWGGFAIFSAENYGCRVTTTTISQAQFDEASQRIQEKNLDKKITLLKEDYRDLTGKYDKLVSIEMIEAVGHQYLDGYFEQCAHLLKPNGLALIQAITIEDTRYKKALKTVDFIKRYVFPGSFIPCNTVMLDSAAKSGLKLMDLEDLGISYAKTIACWRENFIEALPKIYAKEFDDYFIRLWNFYLCYCQGGFEEQVISDVHLLLSNSMAPNS